MASTRWKWLDCDSKSQNTKYIRELRPTKEENTANRSALGKIVHVVHQHVKVTRGIPVKFIKVCGSDGKKTDVHKSSDLDLVVHVEGLEQICPIELVPFCLIYGMRWMHNTQARATLIGIKSLDCDIGFLEWKSTY